jgi:hypothetical protein
LPPCPPHSPFLVRRSEISNGTFIRELLPIMCMKNIIDPSKLQSLSSVPDKELDGAVTSNELMQLAIAWGITTSGPEFWKTHRGKNDVLIALYDYRAEEERKAAVKRYEIEQARQKALLDPLAAPAPPSEEHTEADAVSGSGVGADASNPAGPVSVREHAQNRRRSLVAVGQLFNQEYQGDQFGTRGEYVEGMIYASRRLSMDAQSRNKLEDEKKAHSAIAQAARIQARRRSSIAAIMKREFCVRRASALADNN